MTKLFKIIILFIFAIIVYIYVNFLLQARLDSHSVFQVQKGETLIKVADKLYAEDIVRSPTLFKVLYTIKKGNNHLISYGEYNFSDKSYNLLEVVNKFVKGPDRSGTPITFPEGFTNEEMANKLQKDLDLNKDEFIEYSENLQGRLFPETYFFVKGMTVKNIVDKMLQEFDNRVGQISHQDLVLASIVEGEAKTVEDMKIVAGILQERQRIGMPLQVDVAMETYKTIELPLIPINNPGLNAIEAVRHPVNTEYLYYITGNDGKMYYAKTYEKHKDNIEKYLK
ncbi:MAG: hypothetical protein QG614_547 [Patescibacteria group bacterium]|nr:hypothetical protein [Patescibacteria group bacterium]